MAKSRAVAEAVSQSLACDHGLSFRDLTDPPQFLRNNQPDIVVVLGPDDSSWSKALARVRDTWPEAKLLAVGVANRGETIGDCIAAGPEGVVLDQEPMAAVSDSMVTIESGGYRLPPPATRALLDRVVVARDDVDDVTLPLIVRLSVREREILDLITLGSTNKEICCKLGIGVQTVKNHVTHLLRKLEVRSRADAARRATDIFRVSENPIAGSCAG